MNEKFNLNLEKNGITLKIIGVVVMCLLFLIPLGMIKSIIHDRNQTKEKAEHEIISMWGGKQTIAGPFIRVPYRHTIKDVNGRIETKILFLYILPEDLEIKGELTPEIRYRGIYEVPLYLSNFEISGSFRIPDISDLMISDQNIDWKSAILAFEFPDTRAINNEININWNNKPLEMKAGSGKLGIYNGGIWTKIELEKTNSISHTFNLDLQLRGGKSLQFMPYGKKTRVKLTSSWNSPSFNGAYLPVSREISDSGFSSEWFILSLARSYPQAFKGNNFNRKLFIDSKFGLDFYMPVDTYLKSERAIKYGILFIIIPFITFFLFEIFTKIKIHPIQYIFVGLANTIFYLLLISISEHLNFNYAYFAGSTFTTLLIVFYSSSILKDFLKGIIMFPITAGSYIFLYTTLQSEDYALLIGSIGLFLILCFVMFLTRRINWYDLNRKTKTIEN